MRTSSLLDRRVAGVRLSSVDGVAVVCLSGPADTDLLPQLRELLDRLGPRPVILDITDVALGEPRAARELVAVLDEQCQRGDRAVVSQRPSSRAVLRRRGACRTLVHPSIREAKARLQRPRR